jgi:hypothetical protein
MLSPGTSKVDSIKASYDGLSVVKIPIPRSNILQHSKPLVIRGWTIDDEVIRVVMQDPNLNTQRIQRSTAVRRTAPTKVHHKCIIQHLIDLGRGIHSRLTHLIKHRMYKLFVLFEGTAQRIAQK